MTSLIVPGCDQGGHNPTDLVTPGPPAPPRCARILDAHGRTVARVETMRATSMRVMRLGPDGQPTDDEPVEVPAHSVTVWSHPDPAETECYIDPVRPLRRTITVRVYDPLTGDRARGAHLLL